jgi:hypothetical protein
MRALVLFALGATLALASCGDDSPEQAADKAPAENQPPSAVPGNCERASRVLLAAIATGLEVTGGKGTLSRGFVARSTDFEKVYFVAGEIQGPGLEGKGDVGVWATNSKRAEGLIMAVDGVAQEFSDWGDADKTDAAIDQSADGVEEARACAEG